MKKNSYHSATKVVLLFVFCLLTGCTSIPTSTEQNLTLLVGEVVFSSNDYINSQGISFVGITKGNIKISLRNTETKEIITAFTDGTGFFYVDRLQEGKYEIIELFLEKKRPDGAWANIYVNPARKVLEIEKGKVNNTGTIDWIFSESKHIVIQSDNSLFVQNNFAKRFPKSNWNLKEWIYNTISLPNEIRQQVEAEIKKTTDNVYIQGDTTYYVKSENGLDSVFLTIPKAFSNEERLKAEEHVRILLNEKLQHEENNR